MSADEREVADAIWTLDDDGILDAIESSVSPGVARAVRTLLRATAAPAKTEAGDDEQCVHEPRAHRWAGWHIVAWRCRLCGESTDAYGVPVQGPTVTGGCARCGHDHQGQRLPNEECLVQEGLTDLCPCPGFVVAPPAPTVVHDPATEDEEGRCTEYPDLIDRHGARWVWAFGSEYRARHVLGGWKCRDVGYIRSMFGPVTEVPATPVAPENESGNESRCPAFHPEYGFTCPFLPADHGGPAHFDSAGGWWNREHGQVRVLLTATAPEGDTETAVNCARAEHDADHLGLSTPWCPWCYPPNDPTRPPSEARSDQPWTSRELGDRNAADRMETWLREDKPSRVLDQWTEDLERLIVAARHGRRQPAAADSPSFTCPCGTVSEPCPGPEDRPLCMRGDQSTDPLVVADPCGTCGHARATHHKLRCEHPRCDHCNGWTPQVEDEAALRSKLNEWLAEDGISPYRRTAFVQVLEWLDAHDTASGDGGP